LEYNLHSALCNLLSAVVLLLHGNYADGSQPLYFSATANPNFMFCIQKY